ncbi:hypothetical protein Btru_064909 [Bulinus truncatus]|nr:hypothetical protein Btru_064909 [Bulinus truncatus]
MDSETSIVKSGTINEAAGANGKCGANASGADVEGVSANNHRIVNENGIVHSPLLGGQSEETNQSSRLRQGETTGPQMTKADGSQSQPSSQHVATGQQKTAGQQTKTPESSEVLKVDNSNTGQPPSMAVEKAPKSAKRLSPLASASTSSIAALQKQQANSKAEIDKVLSRGRRPFDIVLKGGTPWGFALNGGKGIPLYISKIVAGGKAGDSALVEGDYVLRVNDVPCSDVGQALDIVDTALTTLTITVLR